MGGGGGGGGGGRFTSQIAVFAQKQYQLAKFEPLALKLCELMLWGFILRGLQNGIVASKLVINRFCFVFLVPLSLSLLGFVFRD